MKKVLAVLLTGVLCAGLLVGCGKKEETPANELLPVK